MREEEIRKEGGTKGGKKERKKEGEMGECRVEEFRDNK